MQPTEANPNQKFTTGSNHPGQPLTPDKGNIHGHELNEKHRTVSVRVPLRTHQHIVQRQQYYTGDA
jgi:hypothetical protein